MNAAVVELDALPDTDWAAADNHRLILRSGLSLVLRFVGTVEVGGGSVELGGTGIHHLVDGADIPAVAQFSYLLGESIGQCCHLLVGKSQSLCLAQ